MKVSTSRHPYLEAVSKNFSLYIFKTTAPICFANQLTGFHMIQVFTERYLRKDYNHNIL